MKEKFYTFCVFACCIGFLFSSCQKEESVLIDDTPNDAITASSVLGQMLLSASQNDGSIDDMIDGNSCFSLNFPMTVYANTQVVEMQSITDIQTIILIFNQSQTDVDTIEIVFPIEIVFEDYSIHTISSLPEMIAMQATCPNNIEDTYSCVSFMYPISCYTYNAESEQIGLVTMNNDIEWFEYIAYLSEGIFIAIEYDMGVIVDNEAITVTSNQELAAILTDVDCGLSTNEIHPEVDEIRSVMKDRTWYVSQFLNDGVDETYVYQDFNFDFRDSISVFAYGASTVVYGTWIVTHENQELNLDFYMESSLSGVNNEAYKVLEQTSDKLTFVTRNSDGDIENMLVLTQN
jgi:hypothetical protein